MERKNTGPLTVETKQTEKKHKTEKTSTNNSPSKSKYPGNIYLEEECKICFLLEIPKLFSFMSGDSLKYTFMANWPKFKSKKQKR